jgi:hypothetical protein
MKTLTLFLLLSSLSLSAQHEPDAVRRRMYDSASLARPIDTVVYQNYRYVYAVKGDTNLVRWELIKKDKLYTDYWKAAGLVYFFESWGELLVLPGSVQQDKILHYGAGAVIGAGSNYLYYRWTKKKWLSCLLGGLTATAVGGIKELTDPWHGGAKTLPDFAWTAAGGFKGSLGVTIVIGHKEKAKKYILP